MGNQPDKHPPNPKGNPATEPDIKIFRFAVFGKDRLENQKQEQCDYQGQNRVFQQIFPNLSACQPNPPSCDLKEIYFESVALFTVLSPPGHKANVVPGLHVRLSWKILLPLSIASTAPA